MNNDWTDAANYHDAAAAHGIAGLHAQAPDELLMQMEDDAAVSTDTTAPSAADPVSGAECLMSLLQVVTWQVEGLMEIRDRVAVVAALSLPDLLPADGLWHGHEGAARARRAMARCQGLQWEPMTGRVVLALLVADGWDPRAVGYRALVLLYCLQRDKALRPPLAASLGTIGEAIGLTATNKRAAVSAACKRLVADLIRGMQRQDRQTEHFDLWFTKSRETRARLSRSMMGKRNRAGGRAAA